MMDHLARHAATHALKTKGEDRKAGGIVLIVLGIFLTPVLIGIPLILIGLYKVFSSDGS